MKIRYTLLAATIAFSMAAPAAAVDRWLFGFSPSGDQTLVTDAGSLDTDNHGWFNDSGFHNGGNSNYFVGQFDIQELRNFFVWSVRGLGTVTSASLEIGNFSGEGPGSGLNLGGAPSVTWTLYDLGFDVDTSQSYSGRTDIFADLGTGVSYGSVTIGAATTLVTVTLNANGIAALNAAIAGDGFFRVGGRLTPLDLGGGVVPEPATWAMLIAGFGLVGATLRRRRALAA